MGEKNKIAFVSTAKDRCRVCYTCVRECPAKAIRIEEGQAEIIPERCIACGNCVRVCSQGAKEIRNTLDEVVSLLNSKKRLAACLAPSFPASFPEYDYKQLVGMTRKLGFDYVTEVAFGADLVAYEYKKLLEKDRTKRYIATTCPAIVGYVERYHPELVPCLAPVVSPMVAISRVLHQMYGNALEVVFFGPCIAKKCEAIDDNVENEISAASTFIGLRKLFEGKDITPDSISPSDFDLPHPNLGALFPISKGMLQAAGIAEDLVTGDVVATDGRESFVQALKEFETGHLDARLLEVLACNGCIMGSAMTSVDPLFSRRSQVSKYVRGRISELDKDLWQKHIDDFSTIDLSRNFEIRDERIPVPSADELTAIMAKMGKSTPEDELNCGACGYDTCREHAIAIFKGMAESEMCLPFSIDKLKETVNDLADSNDQLAKTQEALLQSEKLASMGQLAAGIAHELNNPLGVVLMYSHILLEESEKYPQAKEDLTLITEQADRCKKIVAGLLHFARQNKVVREPANVCELVESSLRTIQVPSNVEVTIEKEMQDPIAMLDRDQMIQVLTNLAGNACAAMPEGGSLTVRLSEDESKVRISIADTGTGITNENLSKIFEPFFTTKEIGMGTGLGLAVSYGIIKMHSGDITVESNTDPDAGQTGSVFRVSVPRKEVV